MRIHLPALSTLSLRERILLGAGVLAACWFLFDVFIYTPVVKETDAAARQIETLEQKLQDYYAEVVGYGLLEQEVRNLRNRVAAWEKRLSRVERPEAVLETFAKMCRRHGVEITLLRPQEQQLKTPAYRSYRVSMELRCTFQQTAQLLADLRALPFFVTVERLQIRHDQGGQVSVTVVLGTFVSGTPVAGRITAG